MSIDSQPGFLARLSSNIVGLVALGTAVVTIAGVGVYVSNLNRDFEEMKAQLKSLSAELSAQKTLVASIDTTSGGGVAGPEGAPGPEGPAGPQGPVGPKGDSGSTDSATIEAMVQAAVTNAVRALPSPTPGTSVIAQPGLFDFSHCATLDDVQRQPTFVVQEDTEICGTDGALLVKVGTTYDANFYYSTLPSGGASCSVGGLCDWGIRGSKKFIVERHSEDGNKNVYLIRYQ